MSRDYARSASPMEKKIGFARAVKSNGFIAVSGTAPIDGDGKTFGVGDVALQTRRCFEIANAALKELDASLSDVVRTRITLTDCAHWKAAANVHGELFQNIAPACTFVVVKGFINPEWLVEIEIDAIVADQIDGPGRS